MTEINPVNFLNHTIMKAYEIAKYALRAAIHAKRSKKLSEIDLRKFKSNPEKKDRIRKLIIQNALISFHLRTQLYIVSSQPIKPPNFEKGGVAIINEGKVIL